MKAFVGWLKLEAVIVFVTAIALVFTMAQSMAWWAMLVVFFSPDLAMLAYGFGKRAGALAYNAVHNYGVGAAVAAVGLIAGGPVLVTIGLLLIAHTGFDRMLGFGLKSTTNFGETHLGQLGKGKTVSAAAGPLKRGCLGA